MSMQKLPDDLRLTIDEEVDVFVSAVVAWEVAIKRSLGKVSAPVDVAEQIRDCGFRYLPILLTMRSRRAGCRCSS